MERILVVTFNDSNPDAYATITEAVDASHIGGPGCLGMGGPTVTIDRATAAKIAAHYAVALAKASDPEFQAFLNECAQLTAEES